MKDKYPAEISLLVQKDTRKGQPGTVHRRAAKELYASLPPNKQAEVHALAKQLKGCGKTLEAQIE